MAYPTSNTSGVGGARARGDRGFAQVPVAGVTLLSLLLLLAVHGLLMGRAAETWDSQIRHELEEDLIAKGEEYKRAIEEFQSANGRPPTKFEELCPKGNANRRYIRRCWLDPITGKEFRRIPVGRQGLRAQENQQRRQRELDEEERKKDAVVLRGFAARSRESQGPTVSDVQFALPGQESRVQLSGDQPFDAVASDSDAEGFRTYNGRSVYSEWEFAAASNRFQPAPQQRPPGLPGTSIPGGTTLPGGDQNNPPGQQ